MDNIKLLLLDLDGTLAIKWKPDLLPGRLDELERLDIPVAIVTNQGGVHARYHWEAQGETERAKKYPTVERLLQRLEEVSQQVPQIQRAYIAFYVGHDSYKLPDDRRDVVHTLSTGVVVHGAWDPAWRKPAGGMIRQACCDLDVEPAHVVMAGDNEVDRQAAHNAGNVRFVPVDDSPWEEGIFAP
jgi:histidinol phosphatase-like enzyme